MIRSSREERFNPMEVTQTAVGWKRHNRRIVNKAQPYSKHLVSPIFGNITNMFASSKKDKRRKRNEKSPTQY